MKTRILFLTLVTIAAFTVTAIAAEVWVSSGPLPQTQDEILNYWTPERMASARPVPMGISGAPTDAYVPTEQASGTPGLATSSATGRASVLLKSAGDPELAEIAPTSSTYPFPHTTYKVLRANYLVFPYKAIGKVFFTKATGGNYVCSGSSIGGRAVLTAGHCVAQAKGDWHKNWAFVPAYRGWSSDATYQRPYGTWTSAELWTFTAWKTYGYYARDVGFAVTNNVSGTKLSAKVGYLGFAWNQTRNKRHWDAFGYPSAYNSSFYPWNGQEMVQTEAEWARDDATNPTYPSTVGIGTAQRPGCSGGPWIMTFWPNRDGPCNYANGVFSYYYTTQPDGMYSPYFDTAVSDFRNSVVAR